MKIQPVKSILILFFIFSSCQKDGNFSIEPSSLFFKSSKEKKGSLRVFSGNGEVKDQLIIKSHIDSDTAWISGISYNLFPNTGRLDTIRFADSKNAIVYHDYSFKEYTVAQQQPNIFLTGKENYQSSHYGDLYSKAPSYWICQYKPPVYSEYLISSTGGNYDFGYETRNEFVLTSEKGVLKATWIVMIANYGNRYTLIYLVQNKPDFNFYRSLTPADTVVLQEYSINYKKL
jgi:hypothetical protein